MIPLLHYDFTMDACQAMEYEYIQHQHDMSTHNNTHYHSFINQGALKPAMSLHRNVNATKCALGMGIEAKHARESSLLGSDTMDVILKELQDDNSPFGSDEGGLTMTFWIRHAFEEDWQDDFPRPLLTIGATMTNDNNSNVQPVPSNPCDNAKVDFQISIICKHQIEWIFRSSDPYFSPCQRVVVDLPDSNLTIAHISVSLANRKQQLFYNGKLISQTREMFNGRLQHWGASSELHFFPQLNIITNKKISTVQPWGGQLFQFSMFSGTKDKQDIAQLLSEGLPPTQPFAIPMTAYILEDAKDESGNVQSIQLPISYLDQEVDSLLSALELVHQPASKPSLYITKFPSRGHLILPEGNHTVAAVDDFPALIQQNTGSLIFLPLRNEHSGFPGSPYAFFQYCWTTNMIMSSSQCASATVSVIVASVNDPPVAIVPGLYTSHEGIIEEKQALLLTGLDVDSGDYIKAIQVTKPPSLGYLYLSVGSFREHDNLLHGTLLSEIDYTLPGKEAYVEYRFAAYDQVVTRGNSVTDFFRFRVQDSTGTWSEEAEAEIHVLSSLFPRIKEYATQILPSGDGQTDFLLSWDDKSGLDRTSGVFIESLPKRGTLVDNLNQAIRKQSVVVSSTADAVNVTYHSSLGACSPEDDFYLKDFFSYRIASIGVEGQITSISNLTTELLSVQCPVEPLILSAKHDAVNVKVFPPGMEGPCNGYNFNFSNSANQCDGDVVLVDVQVQNFLRQPEPILVTITTLNGFVTLNHEVTRNAKLIGDQEVMRSKIRLLSPPEKLQDILSGIHFQSETVGPDEIRVVVEYGRCNQNMRMLLEDSSSFFYPECYQDEIAILIDVHANMEGSEDVLYREFPWIPLPFSVSLLLLIKLRGKAREISQKHKEVQDLTNEEVQDIEWEEHYDFNSGNYFYMNLHDGEITWEHPQGKMIRRSSEGPRGFSQRQDDSSQHSYDAMVHDGLTTSTSFDHETEATSQV
jgi:hypothetical protein